LRLRVFAVKSIVVSMRHFLVNHAVLPVGFGAEFLMALGFVGLVIALKPAHLAFAVEREDMRGVSREKAEAVLEHTERSRAEV